MAQLKTKINKKLLWILCICKIQPTLIFRNQVTLHDILLWLHWIMLWPNSKLKFTSFAHLHLTNNWASSFGKSPIKYSNDMVFFIPRGLGYFLSSVPSLGLDSGKNSPSIPLSLSYNFLVTSFQVQGQFSARAMQLQVSIQVRKKCRCHARLNFLSAQFYYYSFIFEFCWPMSC